MGRPRNPRRSKGGPGNRRPTATAATAAMTTATGRLRARGGGGREGRGAACSAGAHMRELNSAQMGRINVFWLATATAKAKRADDDDATPPPPPDKTSEKRKRGKKRERPPRCPERTNERDAICLPALKRGVCMAIARKRPCVCHVVYIVCLPACSILSQSQSRDDFLLGLISLIH